MPKWVTYVLIAIAAWFLFFRRAFASSGVFPMISPQNAPPASQSGYVTEQQWLQVGGQAVGGLFNGLFNWSGEATAPGGTAVTPATPPADSGVYTF